VIFVCRQELQLVLYDCFVICIWDLARKNKHVLLLCSIYMQTIEWLLEVKAISFTERALANQLIISTKERESGPTADYFICMARLKLQKKELAQAEEELNEALQRDYQVLMCFSQLHASIGRSAFHCGPTHSGSVSGFWLILCFLPRRFRIARIYIGGPLTDQR